MRVLVSGAYILVWAADNIQTNKYMNCELLSSAVKPVMQEKGQARVGWGLFNEDT